MHLSYDFSHNLEVFLCLSFVYQVSQLQECSFSLDGRFLIFFFIKHSTLKCKCVSLNGDQIEAFIIRNN